MVWFGYAGAEVEILLGLRFVELLVMGFCRKMGGNAGQLAYVVVYVPDVNQAAEFYQKVFGLEIRPQNKSNSYV